MTRRQKESCVAWVLMALIVLMLLCLSLITDSEETVCKAATKVSYESCMATVL